MIYDFSWVPGLAVWLFFGWSSLGWVKWLSDSPSRAGSSKTASPTWLDPEPTAGWVALLSFPCGLSLLVRWVWILFHSGHRIPEWESKSCKASYILGSDISTPSLSTDKSKPQGQPRFGEGVETCVKKLMLTLQTGMDTRVGWFTTTILIPVTTMRNWFVGLLSLRYFIDIWVEVLSRLLDTGVWIEEKGLGRVYIWK